MCGLSGIVNIAGIVSEQRRLIRIMSQIQEHRGPDSTGFCEYSNVLFAHNRLSLIDLNERSNQPFVDDSYSLIFNGEIYNYLEIKQELIDDFNLKFIGTSDTEVLFQALKCFGIRKTLDKIEGMFAFAFYDLMNKQLYLVRDRIGIKPLFYSERFGCLYFSSELKALTSVVSDLKLHSPRFLQSALGALEESRRFTAFDQVYQLEPGSMLRYDISDGGTMNLDYYFKTVDWVDESYYERLNRMSAVDVVNVFEGLFDNSIRETLIADANLGAFVSGGIDSSLCVSFANKYRNIKLYSANVLGKYSEIDAALTLANFYNLNLISYDFEPEMFIRDWVACTWYYDSPVVIHPSAIPFQNVAALAKLHGDKAVITGEGSDELFLGYPRLLVNRYNKVILAPRNILNSIYSRIPGLKRYLNLNNSNYFGDVGKMSFDFDRQKKLETYKIAFDFLKYDSRLNEQLLTPTMIDNSLHSLLWRNDRMGMMHSIESRFPFLTDAVIRFGINLPAKFKIGFSNRFHNWKHPFLIDKAIVRSLGEKLLPGKLARRKKDGFPMYGQMFLKVEKNLFLGGFWQESMQMSNEGVDYMVRNIDSYLLAKLASVEIWGRLFCWRQSIEQVNELVLENARMQVNG